MNFRTPSCLSLCMRVSALFLLFAAGAAGAVEFNGYAVLTTDYVFRGVTYSDGDPAAQLGGDVSFDNGLYGGIWASTIDIENGTIASRDLEVDYYLGYAYPLSDAVTLGVNAVVYTFPDADGIVDYDYEEYSLNVNVADVFWVEYAYSPDIFNTGIRTQNVEAYAQWALPADFTASGGVGYYDVSDLSGDGYAYWELGVTRPAGPIELDLRYHDVGDWVRIISNPQRVGARFVLSARLLF